MHECTSPPQTPTPRAGNTSQSSVTATAAIPVTQINDPTKAENTNKMSSVSPITVNTTAAAATNITTNAINAQQQQQQQQSSSSTTPNMFAPNGNLNVSQLDLEFPKLTPPKSKSPR